MFDSESNELFDGIKLFNDHDYFSAHDFFENMWNETDGNKKLFFQGLVQISVGCFHIVCGNIKGAASQLSKSKSKLKKFSPEYLNVNVDKLLKDITVIENQIYELRLKKINSIDLNLLPKINFIN